MGGIHTPATHIRGVYFYSPISACHMYECNTPIVAVQDEYNEILELQEYAITHPPPTLPHQKIQASALFTGY